MSTRNMGFVKRIVHFFYPADCLHCHGTLDDPRHLLCGPCYGLIEWIQGKSRCFHCYAPKPCPSCEKCPRPLRPHRSLFEGIGPIVSLYEDFQRRGEGTSLISFVLWFLAQSEELLPEVVVPATLKLFPAKDPSYRLAKSLASKLKCPFALPRGKLAGKRVLLFSATLDRVTDLLEIKDEVQGQLPKRIDSLALIDWRPTFL